MGGPLSLNKVSERNYLDILDEPEEEIEELRREDRLKIPRTGLEAPMDLLGEIIPLVTPLLGNLGNLGGLGNLLLGAKKSKIPPAEMTLDQLKKLDKELDAPTFEMSFFMNMGGSTSGGGGRYTAPTS